MHISHSFSRYTICLAAGVAFLVVTASLHAAITNGDFYPQNNTMVGSGNGTLDFILLTESAGGSNNSGGIFNGDDANTAMPTGGGHTTASTTFITSFGAIRGFYRYNFPDGLGGSTVDQMVLFLDINQIGGDQHINLDVLKIIKDYNQIYGDARDNPWTGNPNLGVITSAMQNNTNTNFSGGTQLQTLATPPVTLQQQLVGAGHADWAIFTHINPFDPAYSDSTRFLLHWESSDHDDGGETVFLSGTFGPHDGIPEPATLGLLAVGLLGLRRHR